MFITFCYCSDYGLVTIKWPICVDSFRKYEWILILFGLPISWVFLEATRHGVAAFDGLLWPQRFLAFACGIIIFSLFTWLLKGEGINTKTLISLCLASCLVLIQIFWK